MTRQKVQDQQVSFAGGLNTVSDPAFLRPDQARQLTNLTLNSYGAATKRLGTQYVSAAGLGTAPRRALYWAKNNLVIFGGSSTTCYYIAPAVGSAAAALGGTALSQSYLIDQCVFSDGTNEVMYLLSADALKYTSISTTALQRTNTGASSVSAAISGVPSTISGMCVYNQRLWGWYSGLSNLLYYSANLASASSIGGDSLGVAASGGGSIKVNTFGASNIIACQTVGASLMIFHQRGVSRLTGWGQYDTSVQPQAVASGISLWGRQSIAEYQGTAWFMTTDGLYRATESSVERIGTPDRPDPTVPYLSTVSASASGDPNVLVRFNSAKSQVWILLPAASGTASILFIYDTILQAWCGPYTGSSSLPGYGTALSLTEVVGYDPALPGSSGFPAMWMGTFGATFQTNFLRCEAPGLYLDRVLSDGSSGTAYTATLQPHRMYGQGDRSVAKAWRWVNVVATLDSAGTAPVMTSTTQLGSSNVQTFSTLTSVQQPYYCQGAGVGPWIDVVISDTSATASQYEHVDVDGFILGQR